MKGHTIRVVMKDALVNGLKASYLEKKYQLSHGTARRIIKKIELLNLKTIEDLDKLTNTEIESKYYERKTRGISQTNDEKIIIRPDFKKLESEYLTSKYHKNTPSEVKLELTRASILELYYYKDPDNIKLVESGNYCLLSESHCITLWRQYRNSQISVVYRKNHEMGQEVEFDFTGVTLPYGDPLEGKRATFLVSVLPASGYIVVKAIESQRLGAVLDGYAACLKEIGGVPATFRIDNFKAAVNKAGLFGGEINSKFADMAKFFGAEVYTCRPNCGQDKATVEACVKAVTRYALSIANLHIKEHGPFKNLNELNCFIKPLIDNINNRHIRGLNKSRKDLFELEKQYLMQPASWGYRYSAIHTVKIPETGRIVYEKHEYALPQKWINKDLQMEVTANEVIFRNYTITIASYKRKDGENGVSAANIDYLNPQHLIIDIYKIECQLNMLIEWAGAIGPSTVIWCRDMLKTNIRWSEKVRRVVYVLSLPNGYIARYKTLDLTIEKLHSEVLYWPATASSIQREYIKAELSAEPEVDAIYNEENYHKAGKSFIKGESAVMVWPVRDQNKNPQTNLGTEYLNGKAYYASKFAEIALELTKSTKVPVNENFNCKDAL